MGELNQIAGIYSVDLLFWDKLSPEFQQVVNKTGEIKINLYLAVEKLQKAFKRLEEAIPQIKDDLDRGGLIQLFEFTVELSWKTLKLILAYQGIECASLRRCIKEAFRAGIIKDDEILLDMLEAKTVALTYTTKQRLKKY